MIQISTIPCAEEMQSGEFAEGVSACSLLWVGFPGGV